MRINVWKIISATCCVLLISGLSQTKAAEPAQGERAAVAPSGPDGSVMPGPSQTKTGELAQEEQTNVAPPGPEGTMMGREQPELTSEQINHILAELKERNPQEANELTKLREKDPNVFRTELRKHMLMQFTPHMYQMPQGQMPMMMPGPGAEFMHEIMQEKTDEFLKCLKENYPDEATKLEQIKKDNPEQYTRAMMLAGKKYGPICQAAKDDPNLAKVLKQQLELKGKRSELLKQIGATTDEKQKKALTAELEQVVGQQFDLIVKRKQMAYEELTKKLADLQKEVSDRKAEVDKWNGKDFKNQKVKERVTELLNEKEKFEWDN